MKLAKNASRLAAAMGLSVVAGLAAPRPVLAADADAQESAHALRAEEGPLEGRLSYMDLRRRGPGADFNAAAARAAAMQQRLDAMRRGTNLPAAYQHAEAWEPVGPAPLVGGQTPTSPWIASPVSGRVSAIAIDAADGVVFVGGAQGGVWRSDNLGVTWRPLTDELASLAVGAIAIAPGAHARNQATLYVGTGEGNYSADSYAGVGIYKSTDSGRTWSGPYGSALFTNRSVNSIVVDRSDPNNVLAVTGSGVFGSGAVTGPTLPSRGIFRSTDGGVTWTKMPTQATNDAMSRLIQDPAVATRFWAAGYAVSATTGGVQRSDDGGATWTQVAGTGGLPPLDAALSWGRAWIAGATDPDSGNAVLYLGNSQANGNIGGGRIYKSVDGGTNWTELTAARGYCQGQCFYDLALGVEPTDPDVLYTGGAGNAGTSDGTNDGVENVPSMFMRSDDGGATFVSKIRSADRTTALHADVHAIESWPGHPNEIWVGNDGGVWRSPDGGDHWINLNTTLQITQFQGCDLHPTDPNGAYGGTQDNGTNGWAGSVGWPHLDFGDGGFARIDQGNPQNLVHTYFNQSNYLIGVGFTTGGFATTQGNYFASTADSNPSVGNGIDYGDRVLFYAPIHLDRGHSDTLYFGTNRLWKAPAFFAQTVDQNGNGQPGIFSALGAGSGGQDLTAGTIGASSGGAISAIETVANPAPGLDAEVVFTGSSDGHVFRSTDGGASFAEVDALPAVIGLFVSDIKVNPRNPQIVFQSRAGFTGALPAHNIRKSIDGGATWTDASIGLPDVPVSAIAFDPVAPNTLWAGTDIGVYLSVDGGATWNPYTNGLPNVAVFDLVANHATGTLLACTHGRGAFRLKLDAIFIDGFDGD